MKRLLFSLVVFTTLAGNAQTKKVTHSDFKTSFKEVYYALKSNDKIREGEYKAYNTVASSSSLLVQGYYHENQKDSVWTYYSASKVVAQGQYKDGKKVGVWIGYTRGFSRLEYNFDTNELANYVPTMLDSAQQFNVIKPAGLDTVLDRAPIYINGIATLNRVIQETIRYLSLALSERKQGEVIVTFTIDENGSPGNYTVKKKVGFGMDDAALNAVQKVNGEWVPAVIKGKRVAVECEIPILFAMSTGETIYARANQIVILVMGITSVKY
ncbi:TonB family protein [Mucilaginibacter lutimaris]|uniref:TonB family protein n=1 Tax=Mucilaginibacter lutimaris TaxID=931629 RepID=A0ABW2ZJS9_9SPHI